eukprot:826955-Prymnesium_polylepis.1
MAPPTQKTPARRQRAPASTPPPRPSAVSSGLSLVQGDRDSTWHPNQKNARPASEGISVTC